MPDQPGSAPGIGDKINYKVPFLVQEPFDIDSEQGIKLKFWIKYWKFKNFQTGFTRITPLIWSNFLYSEVMRTDFGENDVNSLAMAILTFHAMHEARQQQSEKCESFEKIESEVKLKLENELKLAFDQRTQKEAKLLYDAFAVFSVENAHKVLKSSKNSRRNYRTLLYKKNETMKNILANLTINYSALAYDDHLRLQYLLAFMGSAEQAYIKNLYEQRINTLKSQQFTSRLVCYLKNDVPQTRKENPSDIDLGEVADFIIITGILVGSVTCLALGLRNRESANFGIYMTVHILGMFVGMIALLGAEQRSRETPRINTRVYQG